MRRSIPLLAFLLAGCAATIETEPPEPSVVPDYRPTREIRQYRLIDTIILDDAERRWIVSPRKILELSGEFFSVEYAAEEGIAGTITAIDQDATRLWIGTTRALQVLEKDRGFIHTFIEERGLDVRYVASLTEDFGIALMSRGAALIDAPSLSMEIFPLPDVDVRDVTDTIFYGEDLWVGTTRGLRRFSVPFKHWNASYGSKALARAAVVRLEAAQTVNPNTGQVIAVELYAVTAGDVFVYRPSLDTWERVGF